MLVFRTLRNDEIEVRVSTLTEKGVTLLLYKDARVDQKILDETVGPYNWQRHHSRDNANCVVSIWDEEKKQWIEKEDVGTENFTEKEKSLASDSFKRSCFNWGIGRELYTAPFIYVPAERCDIKKNSKGKLVCNTFFGVKDIGYDDSNNIISLVIYDRRSEQEVYVFRKKGAVPAKTTTVEDIATETTKATPTPKSTPTPDTQASGGFFASAKGKKSVEVPEKAKTSTMSSKMTLEKAAHMEYPYDSQFKGFTMQEILNMACGVCPDRTPATPNQREQAERLLLFLTTIKGKQNETLKEAAKLMMAEYQKWKSAKAV